MPSYIVRNGQLELRQKDFNVPNYRIIPYKSSINPTPNDYLTNTIDQLQKQVQKANQDYRNLIQTMWKIFSEIDRTSYDPQIMFMDLKCEEIYDKISLIRSLNAYQPQQQSLRLSAIMKVDDNTPIYQIEQHQPSPQRSKIRQEIKQDSLYEIQEQEQCMSISSHRQNKHNHSSHDKNSQKQKISNLAGGRRLSLQNITSHKRQGRRSSILLKQKISIAFHEQQQLRQLLQQELEKITQQLEEKNQCLVWTVDELKVRNQLIEKLKETIWQRDQALEVQQQKLNDKEKNFDSSRYQQIVDQKDRQIGLLINSLIERTQETNEDIQFLTKSVKATLAKVHNQAETREQEQQKKIDQSIYLDELQSSIKELSQDKVAKSPSLLSKQVLNTSQTQSLQYSALKPKKMNFDSAENITYLTKQHFLQAEKKSQNFVLPNIKMTESIKPQHIVKSPSSSS